MKLTIGTLSLDITSFDWNRDVLSFDCLYLTEDELAYLALLEMRTVTLLNQKCLCDTERIDMTGYDTQNARYVANLVLKIHRTYQ